VFDNQTLPEHLIVVGGGPIGLELAQAHRRLGARVTVLEAKQIMPKDDAEAVDVVRKALASEGVVIREDALVTSVAKVDGGVAVGVTVGGENETVSGSHLLLAAGRSANVGGLNLEAAGVKYSRKGIEVDAGLRTSNAKVFAIGDVAGSLQFTHVASYHAGLIIRRLLFKLPVKTDLSAIPWCTFTDPELAQVGLTEAQASEMGLKFGIAKWPVHDNDRAQAERGTAGFAKLVVVKGRPVGATIVAPRAGELVLPWVMAIGQKMKLSAMTGAVAAYPTYSEISKRAASAYFTPTLFSPRTKWLVKLLSRLG
jgi:pyruvate/2-oxoglutarate dehydrogenase complex dihydrolipoamide dehydrogenase (E3) component